MLVRNEYTDDDPIRSHFYKSFAEPSGVNTNQPVRAKATINRLKYIRVRSLTHKSAKNTINLKMHALPKPSKRLLSRESNSIRAADLLEG